MARKRSAHDVGGLAGRRILVVEDEYFIADDLSRALQRHGARVVGPVPDLAAGLDLATRDPLDSAVLDVNLGGEMSYPIADRLSERGVPFLFTTGYDERTLDPGYAAITRIEKPFESSMVMMALIQLVGERPAREAKS